jgi:hypothetical protein
MALPKMTTPAQGATHNHMNASQRTFYWNVGSPPVAPRFWRVKVGATPGSWNYAISSSVAEPTHQIIVTFTRMPPTGKTCYTFVEWGSDGVNFPNHGDITSFICKP